MATIMNSLTGSGRPSSKPLQPPRRTWLRGLRYLAPGLLILLVTAGFDLLNMLGTFGIDIDWSRRTWMEIYAGLLLFALLLAFRGVWVDKEDWRLRTEVGDELVRWQKLIREHAQERPRTETEYKSWANRAEDLLASLHTFLRTKVSAKWARAVEQLEDITPSDTRNFWNNDKDELLRRLKRTDERLSQFLEVTGTTDQPPSRIASETLDSKERIRR